MTLLLYAELLHNIRTLSIQSQLATISNQETKAQLSAHGSALTLQHEGEEAHITLPVKVPGGQSNIALTLPAAPTKDLSFRLQLEERPGTKGLIDDAHQCDENITPWSAPSLTADTSLHCKRCSTVIVSRGTVKQWKDLPSENWAEMMEFWHCHKPHDTHPEHEPSKEWTKETFQNFIPVSPATGLVDIADFGLWSGDCSNVVSQESIPENNVDPILHCKICTAQIGVSPRAQDSCLRLRKAALSISKHEPQEPHSYPLAQWLAALLLTASETSAVRRFVVHSEDRISNPAFKLWIFSPDLRVSSSAAGRTDSIRVVKILWQECEKPKARESEKLSRQTFAEKEILLPSTEIDQLLQTLKTSAHWLPENARVFQGWNVGLLERFVTADVSG